VPAVDVLSLQADPNVEVVGGLAANFRSVQFNTTIPPFDDYRVRQAFAYAIDKQAVVDLALFGTGGVVARGTTVPAGELLRRRVDALRHRDVEKARALLAEAGLADGFEFDFYITSTYDFLRDPAEIIQSNLADIGVTATIRMEDWSIFLPNYIAGDFVVLVSGSSGQTDPDAFLYTPFHSTSANNFGKFSDARVDELLTAGRQEPDPEARRELYVEAQERILELSPHVFLFHSAQYSAHRPRVQGFVHFPNTRDLLAVYDRRPRSRGHEEPLVARRMAVVGSAGRFACRKRHERSLRALGAAQDLETRRPIVVQPVLFHAAAYAAPALVAVTRRRAQTARDLRTRPRTPATCTGRPSRRRQWPGGGPGCGGSRSPQA
jgi:hypothetical protein